MEKCDNRKMQLAEKCDGENIGNKLSNHQLARRYEMKSNLIGNRIKLDYLSNDRVILVDILDKESNGSIMIPSFVTDILITHSRDGDVMNSPFSNCNFKRVYIDNEPGRWFSAEGLFYGMESTDLTVEFSHSEYINDMGCMFKDCHFLKRLNISSLNTHNVVSMDGMFEFCEELIELDLSNFDTSNVKSMRRMFCACNKLKRLNLSNFDTSNVEFMNSMFYECLDLAYLDISSFKTSKVLEFSTMFANCLALKSLDLRNFDTHAAKDMDGLFSYCVNLKNINLTSFNTSQVNRFDRMFDHCNSIEELDLSNFDFKSSLLLTNMFRHCIRLKRLEIQTLKNIHSKDNIFGDSCGLSCNRIREILGEI